MKISINSQFLTGPYGGGMQFANYMRDFFIKNGLAVVNTLIDEDIDVILHISPFPFLTPKASSYSFLDAYKYKIKHPRTIIIERVNEGDERKGTKYVNTLLVQASKYSDFVIFIASWLRPILIKNGFSVNKPSTVILNGADNNIFNSRNKIFWNGVGKIKIITHHWSSNPNKGHDIYQQLDKLLGNKAYSELFEFTYIGSIPKGMKYKNTKIISPLSGIKLAEELKKGDVYITASQNEPAGMHHIEGALCGLPILYINSGALPEYCGKFGILFNKSNLGEKLFEIRDQYKHLVKLINNYDNTAEKMANEYMTIIRELYEKRDYFLPKNKSWLYYQYLTVCNLFYKVRFAIKFKMGIN